MAPTLTVFLFLLSAVLQFTPALSSGPRFGTLNDVAAATPSPAGFAPRFYMDSVPAIPAQPFSPNPGNVLRSDGLDSRQNGQCPPGSHTCVEANAPGMCCSNDRYCYLNSTWGTQCCSLGIKCKNSECDSDQLFCNITSTSTVPLDSTSTGKQQGSIITSLMSFTTFAACCPRSCSEKMFQCEKLYGGQCCGYGSKCALGSLCIPDPVPSTTMSSTVEEIPSGCSATSQFSCTDGGGCCNIGQVCTFQSIASATSSPICAPAPSGSSGGLTSGAKAGIGVGVALGAAIIIGAVAWLCIRRRRQSGETTATNVSAHEMRQNGLLGGQVSGTRTIVGRHRATLESSGTGPRTTWSEPSTSSPYPPLHDHGRAYSYLGPDAVPGPFTQEDSAPYSEHTITPPMGPPPSDTGGQVTTTGSMPYNPDHIMRPVEMGGIESQKGTATTEENEEARGATLGRGETPIKEVFELMGNQETSSLLDSKEISRRMYKGMSSQ
ncbi:hypothetical protein F4861DRAFT_543205 [Xylaria intraflava]|nr:hypothetical protein F4861DRAFT_543205 [Xylaria intraflava]